MINRRALSLVFLASPLLFAQGTASVSGRVTNSATGAGIVGVTVTAYKDTVPTTVEASVVTGEGGAYKIDNLAEGEYFISPSTYEFNYVEERSTQGPNTLKVSGETRFDLQMSPLASVRGRVLDPEGKPVEGITVKLTGASDVMTDEEGAFEFEKVHPGSWKLSATPKPQKELKDEERVVTTYYPSVLERDRALEIKVRDVDLSGYDIRLMTAPLRFVRGMVVREDGKPEQNATVVLSKRASQAETVVIWPFLPIPEYLEEKHLLADDDGSLEFSEIAEGDWVLRAIVPARDPETNHEAYRDGLTELKVGRSDVEDVQIRTKEGFPIDISVDWGDSPPAQPPPSRNLVTFFPLDGQYSLGVAQGFPGRYFIGPSQGVRIAAGGINQLGAAPGYYLAAAMLGNQDVLGQVVNLSGPTSLKLIYKKGGGSVSGTVENGAVGRVALMADGTPAVRFGFIGFCDANGGFAVPDLPPGEYTALALPASQPGNVEFLRLLAVSGKRVTVEAGGSAQIALTGTRRQ